MPIYSYFKSSRPLCVDGSVKPMEVTTKRTAHQCSNFIAREKTREAHQSNGSRMRPQKSAVAKPIERLVQLPRVIEPWRAF
jgi:hypothetical protein